MTNYSYHLHNQSWAHFLASATEMASLDQETINSGVPSLELMERAGQAIASEILKSYNLNQKSVLIFCGPGNNGGDGLVISRILNEKKINTTTVIAGAKKYSEDFFTNLQKLKLISHQIYLYKPIASLESVNPITEEELAKKISHSSVKLIVDSLLGTGQKSPPKGAIKEIIEIINRALPYKAQVVAVDMPTGFNTDSGEVYTPHLKAHLTVCIELIKKGMFQYPARDICGKIVTVSIGINCSKGTLAFILDQKTTPCLPKRAPWAHKGDFGPSLVIAGSHNMPGAAALAAKATLKAGCSLVTCAYPEKAQALEYLLIPEVIRAPLADNNKGYFTENSLLSLKNKLTNYKSAAVGCGIGTEKETEKFLLSLLELLKSANIPTVVDADALNILAKNNLSLSKNFIITPHPGEAARLLNLNTSLIQKDRYKAALMLSEKLKCISVLKGALTIITDGKTLAVNSTANPYLATAGSGDVLTGIISACLAQSLEPFKAAMCAVYAHGLAGDIAFKDKKGFLIADDIIEYLPLALPKEDISL